MADKLLKLDENKLREQISRLTIEQKRQYYSLEVENLKDPDTYSILHWFFITGLHHFYLGNWQRGIINVVLLSLGCLLIINDPFAFVGAGLIALTFVIELPQLFNRKNIIHAYNNRLMRELLIEVGS